MNILIDYVVFSFYKSSHGVLTFNNSIPRGNQQYLSTLFKVSTNNFLRVYLSLLKLEMIIKKNDERYRKLERK